MKKNDILRVKKLTPKPETIRFLLDFSKSMTVLKTTKKSFLICKN
jgi:hypothetical protein